MTILEAVRALTVGDCPTRREAAKTIRKYFENGDPVERIREEIKKSIIGKWYVGRPDGKTEEVLLFDTVMKIIDKYREPQEERSSEE